MTIRIGLILAPANQPCSASSRGLALRAGHDYSPCRSEVYALAAAALRALGHRERPVTYPSVAAAYSDEAVR